MPDIRDVLKGLSVDDRALYSEVRTTMRRAYLGAHARILPIDQYEATDDAFLDLIDVKVAMLFDRAGVFDHSQGHMDTEQVNKTTEAITQGYEGAATRMLRNGSGAGEGKPWPKGN